MKKKRANRISLKKLDPESRKLNAMKWFFRSNPKDILSSYSRRYGVSPATSQFELEQLGYGDKLRIHFYEEEGIEWHQTRWLSAGIIYKTRIQQSMNYRKILSAGNKG